MPTPRGIIQRLDQELHRSELLPRRVRLLVAVSGGADSVALLRLLVAVNQSNYWGWTLMAGHVDHGIRGRASAGDARFTREVAAGFKVRCFTKRLKLGKDASEDAARTGRLGALKRIAAAQKCYAVVLGHHADDQAETVLLQLFRGTGLAGMAGMAADATIEGLRVVRPLLGFRRAELRGFLKEVGQGYREDASNLTDQYLRNRVRRRVLPAIERVAPGATAAITRTAALVRMAQRVVQREVRRVFDEAMILQTPRRVHLQRAALRGADAYVCGEILREAVLHVGGAGQAADFERITEAVRLIQAGEGRKDLQMGEGVSVHITGLTVTLTRSGRP